MGERKRYSIRREQALYGIVHEAVTQLRIKILKGYLRGYSQDAQEERVEKELRGLGEAICAEYRKSYAPTK